MLYVISFAIVLRPIELRGRESSLGDIQNPMTEAMYYILLALWNRPCHGYAVMQQVGELSGGRIAMGPGTLYGVLTRMDKDGWIQLQEEAGGEEGGRRRKIYCITQLGESALRQEYRRLQRMVEDGAVLNRFAGPSEGEEKE